MRNSWPSPPLVLPTSRETPEEDEVDAAALTSATDLVSISRCGTVKKSFLKLSVRGLPLACIDLRIDSNVHCPISTGIPSKATKRATKPC